MMRGIFFWESSLIAICRGSVSPSVGTSTGAFMLYENKSETTTAAVSEYTDEPNLQCSCPENARALVFCHVRRSYALLVGLFGTSVDFRLSLGMRGPVFLHSIVAVRVIPVDVLILVGVLVENARDIRESGVAQDFDERTS